MNTALYGPRILAHGSAGPRRAASHDRSLSQLALYQRAHRKVADGNEAFLFLVKTGLTREDLQRNIERRPAFWGRFSNWMDKLPSRADSN